MGRSHRIRASRAKDTDKARIRRRHLARVRAVDVRAHPDEDGAREHVDEGGDCVD